MARVRWACWTNVPPRPEDALQTLETLHDEPFERRAAVVDDRLRHRPDDAIGDEGGTGNLEERAAGHGQPSLTSA
jgi:hypothetical protein